MVKQNKNSFVIFEKHYSRLNALKSIVKGLVGVYLEFLSKEHIAKKRKQLAVFSFDHIAQWINLNGVFELNELEIFFEWISRYKEEVFKGIAIDIGANIGNHSLYFSDFFEKIYSFEPNNRTFKVLTLNAELAKNITCFNFGISNSERKAMLNVNIANIGGSAISEKHTDTTQTIKLKTLDSVIDLNENVKLIKIDVEGHEYEALLGSEATIKNNRPIILFEQHMDDFANGYSKVVNLLNDFCYSRFAIIEKCPRPPNALPAIIRNFYEGVSGILFKTTRKITVVHSLEPGFYRFIIALPDWIVLEGTK